VAAAGAPLTCWILVSLPVADGVGSQVCHALASQAAQHKRPEQQQVCVHCCGAPPGRRQLLPFGAGCC
jgi:hypothetical protein